MTSPAHTAARSTWRPVATCCYHARSSTFLPSHCLFTLLSRPRPPRLPRCLIPDLTVGLHFLFIDPKYSSIHLYPVAIATFVLIDTLSLQIQIMVGYDSGKTRSLASTAPLYEITSKHTELVAHWHRQPQPPYTYCPCRRPFEPLARSCFDPNQQLLRELIPTVDFPNGQTFPPRGRRRVPQSPAQIASDAGLAFSSETVR